MTIRAIVFDLDNCLAAADEAGEDLLAPVFCALRSANRGALPEDALQTAFADCWRLPLDAVAAKHRFTAPMLDAAWRAYSALEITAPLRGYDDLPVLRELPVDRYLVTSGFRRLQESKIRALGLEQSFAGIVIDAIDELPRRGKQRIFEDLVSYRRLGRHEVLIVGDSAESEIAAGNALGLATVQILRPGVTPDRNATYVIRGLEELKTLL